ncbi:hypothetical protein HYV31_00060 [candidate division WWE3 bacterium]|nr:hypothetical protein [candidate division WWE3 bacterium]
MSTSILIDSVNVTAELDKSRSSCKKAIFRITTPGVAFANKTDLGKSATKELNETAQKGIGGFNTGGRDATAWVQGKEIHVIW